MLISCVSFQQREHIIDGKRVEAKAAVPRNSGSAQAVTKKMFVGGTVRPGAALVASANTRGQSCFTTFG